MLLKELFGSWSSKLVSKLIEGSGLDAGGGKWSLSSRKTKSGIPAIIFFASPAPWDYLIPTLPKRSSPIVEGIAAATDRRVTYRSFKERKPETLTAKHQTLTLD